MEISENKKPFYNSLVILNNKLRNIYQYNKINLVPFGEFLPFENFLSNNFGIKKNYGVDIILFLAGNERTRLNLGNNFNNLNLFYLLICYEIIYSGKIKKK